MLGLCVGDREARADCQCGEDPDAIDRMVRKYAGELGLDRGYSAHSCSYASVCRRSAKARASSEVRTIIPDPGSGIAGNVRVPSSM
jgi:hypothetical protein